MKFEFRSTIQHSLYLSDLAYFVSELEKNAQETEVRVKQNGIMYMQLFIQMFILKVSKKSLFCKLEKLLEKCIELKGDYAEK